MRPTWAEVSLKRLRENFRRIRARVGAGVEVMAVVKADAYGHGAPAAARALAEEGAAWFGVCSVEEAIELRSAGITPPIFLLSGFWKGEEETLAEHGLVPAVHDPGQLDLLETKNLSFHLKVDTGMGRLGVAEKDLEQALARITRLGPARMEGLCTHLASADQPGDAAARQQTDEQLARFRAVQAAVERTGLRPRWVHLANSAALATRRDTWGNLVRPGIALYGCLSCPNDLGLEPVLSLKSRIVSLRDVPAGAPLGYNARYVAPGPQCIAAVAAGYADGVNRALSNRGSGLVRGRRAPIVGAVSMDLTLLDVTAVPGAEVGDEVTYIGRDGGQEITAAEVAALAGTVPYEILCHISKRVPRVYTE